MVSVQRIQHRGILTARGSMSCNDASKCVSGIQLLRCYPNNRVGVGVWDILEGSVAGILFRMPRQRPGFVPTLRERFALVKRPDMLAVLATSVLDSGEHVDRRQPAREALRCWGNSAAGDGSAGKRSARWCGSIAQRRGMVLSGASFHGGQSRST